MGKKGRVSFLRCMAGSVYRSSFRSKAPCPEILFQKIAAPWPTGRHYPCPQGGVFSRRSVVRPTPEVSGVAWVPSDR